MAVFHDAFEHHLRRRDGDGKTDAHVAARAGVNGGVDAGQMPVHIHQRTARVAGVDRRIGLDEILEGVDAQLVAPGGAYDAGCDSLPHAKRVANGQHLVSHLQGV